jgi:hypothetical protein
MVLAAKETIIKKQNSLTQVTMKKTAAILKADQSLLDLAKKPSPIKEDFDDWRRIVPNQSEKLAPLVKNTSFETASFNENETNDDDDNKMQKRKSRKFLKTRSRIYPDE